MTKNFFTDIDYKTTELHSHFPMTKDVYETCKRLTLQILDIYNSKSNLDEYSVDDFLTVRFNHMVIKALHRGFFQKTLDRNFYINNFDVFTEMAYLRTADLVKEGDLC